MIFLEKKGRFGNFLFQYFLAKFVQDLNPQKIIVFSKNENIYSFNSKNNIDSLVDQYYSLPKFSKILNYIKNKFYQINDENFQDINKEEILSNKNIYIDGFFQNIDFIISNQKLLEKVLDRKKIIPKSQFSQSEMTIHLRHLHHEIGSLDTNSHYQIQPDIDFYLKIIKEKKPEKIKVISSNRDNKIYLKLKEIFNEKIYFDGTDDISDFFNLIYSDCIILSVSTYSLWAALLSQASEVYVPNIGILKTILKEKQIFNKSKYKYIN